MKIKKLREGHTQAEVTRANIPVDIRVDIRVDPVILASTAVDTTVNTAAVADRFITIVTIVIIIIEAMEVHTTAEAKVKCPRGKVLCQV